MTSSRHSFILALAIALSGAAGGAGCSSDSTGSSDSGGTSSSGGSSSSGGASATCDEAGQNAGGLIDVQGAVIFHSMNKLASGKSGKAIDATGLVAEVVDMSALSSGAPPAYLAQASLEGDGCVNATGGSCTFCFMDTNIEGKTEGLAIAIRDTRTTEKLWIATAEGVATGEDLADLQSAGAPLDTAKGFAVTRDALDTVVASLTGVSGDELMKRGVIFGLIYSTPSTSNESGQPVAGATVTPSDSDVTVVYPSSNFQSVGSATGGQGAFLAFPSAPGAATKTTFTVTPPAGDTHTWDATREGVFVADTMYFHVMFAQ